MNHTDSTVIVIKKGQSLARQTAAHIDTRSKVEWTLWHGPITAVKWKHSQQYLGEETDSGTKMT